MSMLTDVAARLVSAGVCTRIGRDLFIQELPDGPDLITAIFQYGGQPGDFTFDGPGDDRPNLQVRTRAAMNDISSGEARARAASLALNGIANTALSGTQYKLIRKLDEPGWIGDDDNRRPEWTQNFMVVKAP